MASGKRQGFVQKVALPIVAGSALTAGLLLALLSRGPLPETGSTGTVDPPAPVETRVEMIDPADRNVTPVGVTSLPEVSQPLRRITAVRPPAAAAAEAEGPVMELTQETVFSRLMVLDASGFRVVVDGKPVLVKIAGIAAVPFEEQCATPGGERWKCGARARAELARLIGGRSVACKMIDESDPAAPVADCRVGPRHLGRWLVENGWADPAAGGEPDFADLASKALIERKGRFQIDPLGTGSGG